MDLKDYFETQKGLGVLATASSDGTVDAAVYARPHVLDDGSVVFIMGDRLGHANLQTNPHAAYLFREEKAGYVGKRLHLTRVKEEADAEKIRALRRRKTPIACEPEEEETRYLVTFRVDRVRALVGG